TPTRVGASIANAKSVSVGAHHGCVLLADGTAQCWGANDVGQLGDGTTVSRGSPAPVKGLSSASVIVAGWYHTCALLAGGTTKCWGDNESGQLGDGTTVDRSVPVGLAIANRSVDGSASTSTGTRAARQRSIAGPSISVSNDSAQPATGGASRATPVVAAAARTTTPLVLSPAPSAISAGSYQTCALLVDATLRCWGEDFYGQLGDSVRGFSKSPVAPYGLGTVTAVGGGGFHTCVL